MKETLVKSILLIMVISMLAACNKQAEVPPVVVQPTVDNSTNIIKDSNTIDLNITKEIPKDFESTILGGLSSGGCFIQTVRRGIDTDLYIVYFKQWKPYDKIAVINNGSTIQIRYDERDFGAAENVMVSFSLTREGKNKPSELYRNGILVTDKVKFGYGIE